MTEDFPRFVEAENTKGVAIAEKFINTLTEFGINTHKMRAQGYDGAANMLGVHRGTQAVRVEQHVPDAVYCHCKAHSLHLSIGHSCGKPLIRNMYSTSHTNHLCPSQRTNALVCKVRTLRKKRWANWAVALYTFRSAFPVVVQALETLFQDSDGKERGQHCIWYLLPYDGPCAPVYSWHIGSNVTVTVVFLFWFDFLFYLFIYFESTLCLHILLFLVKLVPV